MSDDSNVCRTCMRIMHVNETSISLNDMHVRRRLLLCLPELMLDNVLDPKMCTTCNSALALSFRFKGMCSEAERTINNCLQKTSDGAFIPLDRHELLLIGRRDPLRDASRILAEHELGLATNTPLEFNPLRTLSAVATSVAHVHGTYNQAIKTISDSNWDDVIKSTRIERKPKNSKEIVSSHIDKIIDEVSRSCDIAKPLEIPIIKPERHNNLSIKHSKQDFKKQFLEFSRSQTKSTTKNLGKSKAGVTSKRSSTKKSTRASVTRSKSTRKSTGKSKKPKSVVGTENAKVQATLNNQTSKSANRSTLKTSKKQLFGETTPKVKRSSNKEAEFLKSLDLIKSGRTRAEARAQMETKESTPVRKSHNKQAINKIAAKTARTRTGKLQNETQLQKRLEDNKQSQLPKTKKILSKPDVVEQVIQSKTEHNKDDGYGNRQPMKQTNLVDTKQSKIEDKHVVKPENMVQGNNKTRTSKPGRTKIFVKIPKTNTNKKNGEFKATPEFKKPTDSTQTKNGTKSHQAMSLIENTNNVLAEVTTPKQSSTEKTVDVENAIKRLLQTPEYKKLLELQVKDNIITEKLQQLDNFYQNHTQVEVESKERHSVERKLQLQKTQKNSRKKKLRTRRRSLRTQKALEQINLDLAEIKNAEQKQKLITPVKESLSPPNDNSNFKQKTSEANTKVLVKQQPYLPNDKEPIGYVKPTTTRQQQFNKENSNYTVYTKQRKNNHKLQQKQEPHTCDQCDKVFQYISHLNIHKRTHAVVQNFKCDLCDKSFTLEHHLTAHITQHFTAGNHQCLICEKYFSSWHVLKKHEQTHPGEKPFVCKICDRRFTQRTSLEIHQRIHTEERDFICYLCNAAFGQKVHLVGHIRIHTGEKPYACEYCPKAYSKSNVLRDHKALHLMKPYMCNNCNTLFSTELKLNRHLEMGKKSQSGISCGKIYNCGICSRHFTSRYSRDRHLSLHIDNLIKGPATQL